jgi:8-oxo-dGTP diphosphatase
MKKQAICLYLLRGEDMLFVVHGKADSAAHPGMYLPITAVVAPGEGLEACAIREAYEQLGVRVKGLEFRGVQYVRSTTGHDDYINFIFTSDDFEGEPKDGKDTRLTWVPPRSLYKVPMYEGDRIYHTYLRKYRFHVAEFVYEDNDLTGHTLLKAV